MKPPRHNRAPIYLGLKISACVLLTAITLYAHIERQNELTALRLKIPALAKELREIEEENRVLQYEIDLFENPEHLVKLQRTPQFSHLSHVSENQVWTLPNRLPLQ